MGLLAGLLRRGAGELQLPDATADRMVLGIEEVGLLRLEAFGIGPIGALHLGNQLLLLDILLHLEGLLLDPLDPFCWGIP